MVSEARKAWISVAYGRPGDSYAFERFTHTAAAWSVTSFIASISTKSFSE